MYSEKRSVTTNLTQNGFYSTMNQIPNTIQEVSQEQSAVVTHRRGSHMDRPDRENGYLFKTPQTMKPKTRHESLPYLSQARCPSVGQYQMAMNGSMARDQSYLLVGVMSQRNSDIEDETAYD